MDEIIKSYEANMADSLLEHVRHDVAIVTYGLHGEPAVNVSLECEQCGLVLWDTDLE